MTIYGSREIFGMITRDPYYDYHYNLYYDDPDIYYNTQDYPDEEFDEDLWGGRDDEFWFGYRLAEEETDTGIEEIEHNWEGDGYE